MKSTNINVNPLPIIILLATVAFGVFLHDAQVDSALMLLMTNPATVVEYKDGPISLAAVEQHSQSDSNTFSMNANSVNPNQSIAQPLNRDDRKYISKKRLIDNSVGNEYYWPST